MALRKIKLGKYIYQSDEKNSNLELSIEDVRGISTQKMFIDTKANMEGVPLNNYRIVRPNQFAYVPDTSRRGNKISLAFNNTSKSYLVSSISVVFYVDEKEINPEYLFMYFNRPEFDRYSRYNSFGSAREPFNWEDMCDIEIELPDIETQRKFVDVYLSMLENQKSYERGLEDLKLVCEAHFDEIRKSTKTEPIIQYLTERCETNKDGKESFMRGVGLEGFIDPNQERTSNSLKKCNVFYRGDFVYAPSSFKNGVISYNEYFDRAICTEEYVVFKINDEEKLNAHYLLMCLKRNQLGRFIDFSSCDSVRNRFYFKDLSIVEIPVPNIEIQKKIADIYKCYLERKEINEKLKTQIKDICPILIKGSIEEAKEA